MKLPAGPGRARRRRAPTRWRRRPAPAAASAHSPPKSASAARSAAGALRGRLLGRRRRAGVGAARSGRAVRPAGLHLRRDGRRRDAAAAARRSRARARPPGRGARSGRRRAARAPPICATTLTGCAPALAAGRRAATLGDDWRVVTGRDAGGDELYLHRDGAAAAVAARRRRSSSGRPAPAWRAEYRDLQNDLPRSIRVASVERRSTRGRGVRSDARAVAGRDQRAARRRGVPRARFRRRRATDHPRRTRAVRVRAFAKINLSLRVLGARADGYHELRTIFQSLALHDTLTIRARRGPFRADVRRSGVSGRRDQPGLARRRARVGGGRAPRRAARRRDSIWRSAFRCRPASAAAAATRPRRCARWRRSGASTTRTVRAIGG